MSKRKQLGFKTPRLPLRLEFGCGKGGFLARLAAGNSTHNYLGVDIKNEMLVVAKRNIERVYAESGRDVDNVRLTAHNIEQADGILTAADAVDRLYINFCNPWHKAGHQKHRLTHPRQLALYRKFLTADGELWFKTDDEPLFCDTLRYLPLAGFAVLWQTVDLHRDEPAWNIRTEHEAMFAAEGIPIKALIAQKQHTDIDTEALRRLRNC